MTTHPRAHTIIGLWARIPLTHYNQPAPLVSAAEATAAIEQVTNNDNEVASGKPRYNLSTLSNLPLTTRISLAYHAPRKLLGHIANGLLGTPLTDRYCADGDFEVALELLRRIPANNSHKKATTHALLTAGGDVAAARAAAPLLTTGDLEWLAPLAHNLSTEGRAATRLLAAWGPLSEDRYRELFHQATLDTLYGPLTAGDELATTLATSLDQAPTWIPNTGFLWDLVELSYTHLPPPALAHPTHTYTHTYRDAPLDNILSTPPATHTHCTDKSPPFLTHSAGATHARGKHLPAQATCGVCTLLSKTFSTKTSPPATNIFTRRPYAHHPQ